MYENLVKTIINEYDGIIKPLILPSEETNGTGTCNSSLLIEGDKIHLIMRHVEYTLYHSEGGQKYQTVWEGPLAYYHRENCRTLKTNNFYCVLNNKDLSIQTYHKIDTDKLDTEPLWDFVGLEDARLVKWDEKYYLCGVRRDTTTNGQGRMELSEIIISDDHVKEIHRNRIEVPDSSSYCEKNWMPIIDQPFHFVKWANPTEIVKVDLEKNLSEEVYLSKINKTLPYEIRGGTPLIRWKKNQYLCICHDVDYRPQNHNGYKDSDYYHRFIIFNDDYSIDKISEQFNFMTAKIEFCIGLAQYRDDILITFGFQDNSSYIIRVNKDKLNTMIENKLSNSNHIITNNYSGPISLKPRNYELIPLRFDHTEVSSIKEHIETYGFVVIKNGAMKEEIKIAEDLLWKDLTNKFGWERENPKTWTDDAYYKSGNPKTGLMDISHSEAFWYLRCLPGVINSFKCLYGHDDLVSSYDRMGINRPIDCDQESIKDLEYENKNEPYLWSKELHTHYNIDGFGENIDIYYGFMSLSDTDVNTGTTAIVPFSHKSKNVKLINKYYMENKDTLINSIDPYRYHRIFTECGLIPSPVKLQGGDIMIINTKLFHCGCPALNMNNNNLLRVLSVVSMVPRCILSSDILKVREHYYKIGKSTGGSVLGKLTKNEIKNIIETSKDKETLNIPSSIRKLIGDNLDFTKTPDYSRELCEPMYDFDELYQYNNFI